MDTSPSLLLTSWLSPCVLDSSVNVCRNRFKLLWLKASAKHFGPYLALSAIDFLHRRMHRC